MGTNGKKMKRNLERSDGSSFAWTKGLLFGALAGAAAALLFAPRSGEETKQVLREQGEELRGDFEKRMLEGRLIAQKNVASARSTVAEWLAQGSQLLSERAEEMRPQ